MQRSYCRASVSKAHTKPFVKHLDLDMNMFTSLPPLNALRAFESAARLQSMTLASKELHVTHGAISKQIRVLEDFLGFALFVRLHKKVELTDEGTVFLEQARLTLHKQTKLLQLHGIFYSYYNNPNF